MTLVEIVVVIAIIVVLAVVVWLAVGPAAKEKSLETRIRSDLKQIVAAINIYMLDYDGRLPRNFDVLPKDVPRSIPGLPETGSLGGGLYGGNHYFYTQPYRMQVFSERFAKNPFDSEKDPIVKAMMRLRMTGKKENYWMFNWDGSGRWAKRDQGFVLGGRLDGSITWFPIMLPFELEFAALSHRLGRLR